VLISVSPYVVITQRIAFTEQEDRQSPTSEC